MTTNKTNKPQNRKRKRTSIGKEQQAITSFFTTTTSSNSFTSSPTVTTIDINPNLTATTTPSVNFTTSSTTTVIDINAGDCQDIRLSVPLNTNTFTNTSNTIPNSSSSSSSSSSSTSNSNSTSSSSSSSSSNSDSTSTSQFTEVFNEEHFESELNANLTYKQIQEDFQKRYKTSMLKPTLPHKHFKPKFLYIPVTKSYTNDTTGETSQQIRQIAIKNQIRTLSFHENNQPSYKGTFSKKSEILNGRRPFHKDNEIIDYNNDNGNNWITNNDNTENISTSDDETNVDEETIEYDDFLVRNNIFN